MKKILLALVAASAGAQSPTPDSFNRATPPDSYLNRSAVEEFLNRVSREQGLDRSALNALFGPLTPAEDVLAKISKPAEKSKEWFEYKKIFDDPARLEAGVEFFKTHRAQFEAAEKRFGVDKYLIAAILGIETRYGKVSGKTPVLQALATLCFDYPPRAKFFCGELEAYLRLSQRERFDSPAIVGSYAGAMGMAQFMPTSYLNDAIDGDGDGKVDLFNSPADAIFSIGNYLKNRGWKAAENGLYAQQLPDDGGLKDFGKSIKPYQPIKDIYQAPKTYALELRTWLDAHPQETVGTLNLQGEAGKEYWLVRHNFYVITRYNSSPMYAMAAVNLARAISQSLATGKNTP